MAVFGINGKYGYINRVGSVVIQPTFNSAGCFSNGLALVMTEATEGSIHEYYIDRSGEKALSLPDVRMLYCQALCWMSEGLAPHGVWNEKEGTFDEGYIDTTGAEAIPTHFADTSAFSEGYGNVFRQSVKTKEGKRAFIVKRIDKTGQMVLESTLRFYAPYFLKG